MDVIRTAVCPECKREIRISADVTADGPVDIFRRHYQQPGSLGWAICPMSRQPVIEVVLVSRAVLDELLEAYQVERDSIHNDRCIDSDNCDCASSGDKWRLRLGLVTSDPAEHVVADPRCIHSPEGEAPRRSTPRCPVCRPELRVVTDA